MFNASIVLYNHRPSDVEKLVANLLAAPGVARVFLIDNSPKENSTFCALGAEYVFVGRNLGYGAAHNLALRRSLECGVPYHLVLNPDIVMDSSVPAALESYMDSHPSIGYLMPKVLNPDGSVQYLCKLLPTPFDFLFRRFLPACLSRHRMERFELHASGYDRVTDAPFLSGCFMFLRMEVLRRIGLFDERFFMYSEDIDLARRIHAVSRTVFYPYAQVIHSHVRSSYKSIRMLAVHTKSLIRYFNKWGWLFDQERRRVNAETLAQLTNRNPDDER